MDVTEEFERAKKNDKILSLDIEPALTQGPETIVHEFGYLRDEICELLDKYAARIFGRIVGLPKKVTEVKKINIADAVVKYEDGTDDVITGAYPLYLYLMLRLTETAVHDIQVIRESTLLDKIYIEAVLNDAQYNYLYGDEEED